MNGHRSGGIRISGAAQTITEECERLFCEDLRTVFLGEKGSSKNSLVLGALQSNNDTTNIMKYERDMTPPDEGALETYLQDLEHQYVQQYIEVWDYAGGARFRGFTAHGQDWKEKTMFVFFDAFVIGKDLKQGYVLPSSEIRSVLTHTSLMALMELATTPDIACEQLVVCVERPTSHPETASVVRDLGWVGFEPTTLKPWTGGADITSRKWVFLGTDV